MKSALVLLALAGLTGCAHSSRTAGSADSGAYVTLLGTDTLAVERFTRTPTGVEATAVVRAPRTTVTQYRLTLTPDGALERYEATTRLPGSAETAAPLRQEVVVPAGDSLRYTITAEGQTRNVTVAGGASALPFIDNVHWPFELVMQRALASGQAEGVQPLFTERAPIDFRVSNPGGGRFTITHPLRGPMAVTADSEGRLLALDAQETTRKVTVTRVATIDLDGVARRSAAQDVAGRPFGALSGRGEATAVVGGATITVDYGRPARRGRDIFGTLVPYGEVWRTGANLATHFTTSRPLVLAGLDVPAGRYTLYSIPEADGGQLIINRMTDQGGTTYDPAQDLGRVTLSRSALPESVELFTIAVEPTTTGGVLHLQWADTQLSVPFTVAD